MNRAIVKTRLVRASLTDLIVSDDVEQLCWNPIMSFRQATIFQQATMRHLLGLCSLRIQRHSMNPVACNKVKWPTSHGLLPLFGQKKPVDGRPEISCYPRFGFQLVQ